MALRKAGGNWVTGERFFDREVEIEALIERVEDGTHTLVTAQRRMGKTSLVRELLRRLAERGGLRDGCSSIWRIVPLRRDAVVEIAAASRHIRGLWTRLKSWAGRSSTSTVDRIDELGVSELRVRLRAGIDAGRWRTQGDALFASLAASEKPVVLAIDELPILVNRLLKGHKLPDHAGAQAGHRRIPELASQKRTGPPWSRSDSWCLGAWAWNRSLSRPS